MSLVRASPNILYTSQRILMIVVNVCVILCPDLVASSCATEGGSHLQFPSAA